MYRKNMTDDFSSETKRTTDSRTTFVKQRKENIFQFEDETKIFSL